MEKREQPIVGVTVVIVRKKCGIQILTQTRHNLDPNYDSLYEGAQEAVGESLDHCWENILEVALYRGPREELGSPELVFERIIGADGKIFSTRPGKDKFVGFEPYYFIQMLQGPQPWVAICFVALAPDNFEPKLDERGETLAFKWWSPQELLKELENNPTNFTPSYAVLLKVCREIISGKLKI